MVGPEGRWVDPSGKTRHGDVCPCDDVTGFWCSGGMHWKAYDEDDAMNWADTRYRMKFTGKLDRFSEDWKGLFTMAKNGVGRPAMWEICPEQRRRRECELQAAQKYEADRKEMRRAS